MLAKNIYRPMAPASSDRTIGLLARAMVPVPALGALYLALHGGQAIVALLLMGYNVVTQLFPALVLSFGERPRISGTAALAGIIAGECTVAAVTLSGTSIAALAPSMPQAVKDLNIGVVALAVNCVVILVVSLVHRRRMARDLVPVTLRERGAIVDVVDAYRTVIPANAADAAKEALARQPHWITFTSSSTVKNFIEIAGREALEGIKVASIGPVTSATARELGVRVDVEADPHTIEGLVVAIAGAVSTVS